LSRIRLIKVVEHGEKRRQGQADIGTKENFTPKCALCLESIIGSLSVKKLK